MKGFHETEATAKSAGEKETLKEVPDHGPTLSQIVFDHLRAHCEGQTGAQLCPIAGQTREGFCCANWSKCQQETKRDPKIPEELLTPPSDTKVIPASAKK